VAVTDVLARIAEIQSLTAPVVTAPPASSPAAFQALLGELGSSPLVGALPSSAAAVLPMSTVSAPAWLSSGAAGQRALAFAQAEVGQAESPPGSNDSPRIAMYRSAVTGAYGGAPWCAYFVSWAAAAAGAPIGEEGQGYGAVEDVAAWGARTGRLLPAGATPQPGDLILYGGRHIGIVESVNLDGSLTTIEGNHLDAVSRVQRSPAEATGYVRL
jgi:hypothetical protein